MQTYIKKVMVKYWFEFEVWDNDTLVASCISLNKANKILKDLL